MKDTNGFDKKNLENKVGNINDSLDSLMTKPERVFRSKKKVENESQEEKIPFSAEAAHNITFNEDVQLLPGTLGKEYFTITRKEYDAITGTVTDLKDNDVHALRNLQTKLFVTFQYIQDNLKTIYDEESRLETHFDAVNEKIGELGSLLRSLDRSKEKIDREQIESFNQRKNLVHQHSLLNEREKRIEDEEIALQKRNNDLNAFRVTLEDRQKAVQMQQDKIHVFRERLLNEKHDLEALKSKIMEDDQRIDEKYFEIKKDKALIKAEKDKFNVELNTFKNIRAKAKNIREQSKKADEKFTLKKRTLARITKQMEFQKKAFLTGKASYQKLVDQVDHVSNEVERLEHRKSQLVNDNLELHKKKSELTDNLQVLRQVTHNEMEAMTETKKPRSAIRRNAPTPSV